MSTEPEPPTAPGSIPRIDPTAFPSHEQEDVWHVTNLLTSLESYVYTFEDALYLFDHCEGIVDLATVPDQTSENAFRAARAIGWQLIATRDAGMSVYHTSQTVQAIAEAIGKSPTLFGLVGRQPIRDFRSLFARYFPQAHQLRHAVAHSADMAATINKVRANARNAKSYSPEKVKSGFGIDFALGFSLDGRQLTIPHNGKLVGIDLSETTLLRLFEVRRAVLDALEPADKANYPPRTCPAAAQQPGPG